MRVSLTKSIKYWHTDTITDKSGFKTIPKGIVGTVVGVYQSNYYDSENKLIVIKGYKVEWDNWGNGSHDGYFSETVLTFIDKGLNDKSMKIGRIYK